MTLIRLFAAALVVCSTLAFAQTKTDSLAVSDQASASQLAPAASSEPWKFIPNQLADAISGKDPLNPSSDRQIQSLPLQNEHSHSPPRPRSRRWHGSVRPGGRPGRGYDLSKDSQLRGRARFEGFGFHAPRQLFDLPALDALPREDHRDSAQFRRPLSPYVTLLYPIATLFDTVPEYSSVGQNVRKRPRHPRPGSQSKLRLVRGALCGSPAFVLRQYFSFLVISFCTTFLRRRRRGKFEWREFQRRRLARRRWLKFLRRFRRQPQFGWFGLQFECAQLRRIVVARIQ